MNRSGWMMAGALALALAVAGARTGAACGHDAVVRVVEREVTGAPIVIRTRIVTPHDGDVSARGVFRRTGRTVGRALGHAVGRTFGRLVGRGPAARRQSVGVDLLFDLREAERSV